MLSSLILTAFLMGLGGVPHCAAMCGAACAALLPRGVPLLSLLGRCVGYALLGAVAALGFGTVAQWGRQVTFLQPLWIMAQALAFFLGLWLAWSGSMPRQLDATGQATYRAFRQRLSEVSAFREGGVLRAVWPFVAGLAWAVLPCGLLYAAIMIAALAPDALGGALVMLAFAVPGAFGVWGAPMILRQLVKLGRGSGNSLDSGAAGVERQDAASIAPVLWLKPAASAAKAGICEPAAAAGGEAAAGPANFNPRSAIRLSGLMLAAMSAWALYHQVMDQWRAWCA